MSKTLALRKEIQKLIKTKTTNVFYEEASKKNIYPYVVFELSEVQNISAKTIYQLEINCIDYGENSATIEALADDIQKLLNRYAFIDAQIQFVIYQGLKQIIKEDDKKIIRRRMLFELNLYSSEGE